MLVNYSRIHNSPPIIGNEENEAREVGRDLLLFNK